MIQLDKPLGSIKANGFGGIVRGEHDLPHLPEPFQNCLDQGRADGESGISGTVQLPYREQRFYCDSNGNHHLRFDLHPSIFCKYHTTAKIPCQEWKLLPPCPKQPVPSAPYSVYNSDDRARPLQLMKHF